MKEDKLLALPSLEKVLRAREGRKYNAEFLKNIFHIKI